MSTTAQPWTVNLDLARRLERAEAAANAACVEARCEVGATVRAAWIEVAGVYAMFDGISSPLTQTFGLGLFAPFLEPEFDAVEAFFSSRGAETFHEVSSFVPAETLNLLSQRGYSPFEASTVLIRPTSSQSSVLATEIEVRRVEMDEADLWARVGADGWASESPDLAEFFLEIGRVMARARGVHCFLAEADGQPIAAAALNLSNGVALLAGASTIPAARRRGAQAALLEARLRFAADRGVELAMVVTHPGSASQRNAERRGFRPVYTRSKWRLALKT